MQKSSPPVPVVYIPPHNTNNIILYIHVYSYLVNNRYLYGVEQSVLLSKNVIIDNIFINAILWAIFFLYENCFQDSKLTMKIMRQYSFIFDIFSRMWISSWCSSASLLPWWNVRSWTVPDVALLGMPQRMTTTSFCWHKVSHCRQRHHTSMSLQLVSVLIGEYT